MQTTNEGTDVPRNTSNYNSLSYLQKEKFDYLKPLIGNEDLTFRLVTLIEARGRNNFRNILERVTALNEADEIDQDYYNALYDSFKAGVTYSPSEIIGIVSQVRRDVKLPPYLSNWKQKCVDDFLNLFIVHDIYEATEIDDKISKKHIGFRPALKLKLD